MIPVCTHQHAEKYKDHRAKQAKMEEGDEQAKGGRRRRLLLLLNGSLQWPICFYASSSVDKNGINDNNNNNNN